MMPAASRSTLTHEFQTLRFCDLLVTNAQRERRVTLVAGKLVPHREERRLQEPTLPTTFSAKMNAWIFDDIGIPHTSGACCFAPEIIERLNATLPKLLNFTLTVCKLVLKALLQLRLNDARCPPNGTGRDSSPRSMARLTLRTHLYPTRCASASCGRYTLACSADSPANTPAELAETVDLDLYSQRTPFLALALRFPFPEFVQHACRRGMYVLDQPCVIFVARLTQPSRNVRNRHPHRVGEFLNFLGGIGIDYD